MTAEEYITSRLDDQQKFFSSKSRSNKKWYYWFKTVVITIAVIIPFLTGYLKDHECLKYTIGILSVLLALFNGLETFFKFHEKWISNRTTSEALKQEKFMFLTAAGPYSEIAAVKLLAERVETILAKENSTWGQLMKEQPGKKDNPAR